MRRLWPAPVCGDDARVPHQDFDSDGEVTRLSDDPSDRAPSQGRFAVFFVRGFGSDAGVYYYSIQGIERVFSGDGANSGGPHPVVQTGPMIRVADLSGVLAVFEQPDLVFRQPAATFMPIGYGK